MGSKNLLIYLFISFLLISTFGFNVDMHYCNNELKSINFFGKAKSCHSESKVCPFHKNMIIEKSVTKDCCSNQTVEIEKFNPDFVNSIPVFFLDFDFIIEKPENLTFLQKIFVPREIECNAPLPNNSNKYALDTYVLLERFLI